MKLMSENNEKFLKITHLTSMSLWFSCLIIMFIVAFNIPNLKSSDSFFFAHRINYIIDFYVLTPAAIITFITGVLYGAFTKWNVKKNFWLKVKVIITIFLILLGTFVFGPLLSEMTNDAETKGLNLLKDSNYLVNLKILIWSSIINAFILFIAIAVSTLKPGNKDYL